MRRTNIYLTEQEQAALDAVATAEGSSRSDVLRSIVDRELNLGGEPDDELDALLASLAPDIARRARSLSRRDSDLRSD
jgi:Ribbon-helix-helix protein, copG family